MDWDKIIKYIPNIIVKLKEEYAFDNETIKDGIFKILERHCIVVYYPLKEENNCGFHTKRYIKNERRDFVYINTAKPLADQVFTAAHELGHVWNVIEKIRNESNEDITLSPAEEEKLINRFAAELLMPQDSFKRTFVMHFKDLNLNPSKIRVEDFMKVIVMQMNDYLVPYEAVRKRLIETNLISNGTGKFLEDNHLVILELVKVLENDLNTMLDRVTEKKTIQGIRDLLEKVEINKLLDEYTICKIKKDFDIEDDNSYESLDEIINVTTGDY